MNITDKILEIDNTPWRLFEPNDDKEWCVLWLQGFRSTIEGHTPGVIRLAETTSTSFAMLDYAGHGSHHVLLDDATREQQFNEVVGVYDELIKLGFKKIIVIGGSFGGYMAALLAGKPYIETLVLRAAANYPEEEFKLAFRDTSVGRKDFENFLYRQNIDEHYTNDAIESVRGFDGETYVIQHENDEVINSSIPKSYYNAAKHGNYIVIPKVKHSPKLMSDPGKYFELIELWLTTIITATKKSEKLQDS